MSSYKFKTTNIRGKQYVEVNERIKFFRQEDQYKNWSIVTEFPLLDDKQALCKASVVDVNDRVIAVGHAHEEKQSSNINKTSYVENCETSAVGRALAMLGIGIDTSIASANEVSDAIAKQESKPATSSSKRGKPMSTSDLPVRNDSDWAKMYSITDEVVKSDFQKAVEYLERAKDVSAAWSKIEKQAHEKFNKAELNDLLELVKAGGK